MAQQSRSVIHLHLHRPDERRGEILLSELAKVAQQTQRVISRLAQGLIDDLTPASLRHEVVNATKLSLVGLGPGSTVLDIAGPVPDTDTLTAEGMPEELRDMAMAAFVESLGTLSQEHPILPLGVDDAGVQAIDDWLRSLRDYERITIVAEVSGAPRQAEITPRLARRQLRSAETQPSLPYISADHQILTGRLYALNLRTGKFSIEDGTGHTIRLSVPADMRDEAAQLVNRRVRAIGTALLDSTGHLISFEVAAFIELPALGDQGAFFEYHRLEEPPRPISQEDLTQGVISDLSEDEIDAFVSALRSE